MHKPYNKELETQISSSLFNEIICLGDFEREKEC
jgi:hypothetical protein